MLFLVLVVFITLSVLGCLYTLVMPTNDMKQLIKPTTGAEAKAMLYAEMLVVLNSPKSTEDDKAKARLNYDRALRDVEHKRGMSGWVPTTEAIHLFVREYTVDFDPVPAYYRTLAPGARRPKPAQAKIRANKIMALGEFRTYLNKWRAEMVKKVGKQVEVTAESVLREMSRLAFSDVRELFDDNGELMPLSELSDEAAASIVGIDVATIGNDTVGRGQITKVKLGDKLKALENLGKHLGIFNENLNVNMRGGLNNTTTEVSPEELAAMSPAELASLYRDRVVSP